MIFIISLILPTLGEREKELKRLFNSLEEQSYKTFEVIVVSQKNHDKIIRLLDNINFKYKHIKIQKMGISNARNIGLKYVSGDIVTFSDDDCWYLEESLGFINDYFEKYDNEIVCFQHFDPNKQEFPKNYPKNHQVNISKRRILSQSSIDIFINITKVKDYKIGFDNKFGVGAKYNSGEEIIYLMDLKDLGYRIDYYPKIISYHPKKLNLLNLNTYISKAPLFKRLFGKMLGLILFLLFTLKKANQIEKFPLSIYYALKEYVESNV